MYNNLFAIFKPVSNTAISKVNLRIHEKTKNKKSP